MNRINMPTDYVERASNCIADGNQTEFIGYSKLGTPDNSDEWFIAKETIVNGCQRIYYAKGSWDDRLTLDYL